eukprot:12911464-Prorocentrum_lima.AAC.1
MLAAQWGLGALLGEQPEFGGMRVAHDMLNTRVRVALRGLNAKIKALLLLSPDADAEPTPGDAPSANPPGTEELAVPQVTVTLTGVGGRCSCCAVQLGPYIFKSGRFIG